MECPSCQSAMEERHFDGNYGRSIELDLCLVCHGLWFDSHENLLLTPGSILRLFKLFHERGAPAFASNPSSMSCPRCDQALQKTFDMQRGTRFTYQRCPAGHGRFITFFEFLREKSFVRALDPKQLAELRKHLKVVKCSNCGGPVDIVKGSACDHCGSQLSLLDPARVETTLRELQKAEERRTTLDPQAAANIVVAQLSTERFYRGLDARDWRGGAVSLGGGLVEAGLDLLLDYVVSSLLD